MSDPLPLSLVNDLLYCPRRAALKWVEGWRDSNAHTERGDIVHEHSDLAGYEVAKGVLLWRALPVWSERLGLNGKCDIVEVRRGTGRSVAPPREGISVSNLESLVPVEFKLGRRRRWENDDVQLCAQALCLEEMFGIPILRGAVFHADSKRRREVELDPELRRRTERAVSDLRAMAEPNREAAGATEVARLPPAVFRPACAECSLVDVCLPQATADDGRAGRVSRSLFQV